MGDEQASNCEIRSTPKDISGRAWRRGPKV